MNETTDRPMKRCPYCAEEIRAEAIKCRYCGSALTGPRRAAPLQWYRLRRGKMIAGVCAGLADYYGLPVDAVRLATVVLTIVGGWGIILYAVLWILLPYRDDLPGGGGAWCRSTAAGAAPAAQPAPGQPPPSQPPPSQPPTGQPPPTASADG